MYRIILNLYYVLGLSIAEFNPQRVILTDLPEMVSQLQTNILLNDILARNVCGDDVNIFHDRYHSMAYSWGDCIDEVTNLIASPSSEASSESPVQCVCVASDVVYDPEGYVPLFTSILSLLVYTLQSRIQCDLVILAHRSRHAFNERFVFCFNYNSMVT